jgi:hypothetical protein
MNEREKQFSFTRAASSVGGRAKNQIPISFQVGRRDLCGRHHTAFPAHRHRAVQGHEEKALRPAGV